MVQSLLYLNNYIESFRRGRLLDRSRLCDTNSDEFKRFSAYWRVLRMEHAKIRFNYNPPIAPNVTFREAAQLARQEAERNNQDLDMMISLVYRGTATHTQILASYEGLSRLSIDRIYQDIVDTMNRECDYTWQR